jgi:quinol monooxygenase YgiN
VFHENWESKEDFDAHLASARLRPICCRAPRHHAVDRSEGLTFHPSRRRLRRLLRVRTSSW